MILLRPVKVIYGDLWEANCLCGKFIGSYMFLCDVTDYQVEQQESYLCSHAVTAPAAQENLLVLVDVKFKGLLFFLSAVCI